MYSLPLQIIFLKNTNSWYKCKIWEWLFDKITHNIPVARNVGGRNIYPPLETKLKVIKKVLHLCSYKNQIFQAKSKKIDGRRQSRPPNPIVFGYYSLSITVAVD